MCTDCMVSSGVSCTCSGGDVFAVCPCEKSVSCPICNHSPIKKDEIDRDFLLEIVRSSDKPDNDRK